MVSQCHIVVCAFSTHSYFDITSGNFDSEKDHDD